MNIAQNCVQIDSFVSERHMGNRHELSFIDVETLNTLSPEEFVKDLIYVFIAQLDAVTYRLKFIHKQREVKFCGSGIIAAARFVFGNFDRSEPSLSFLGDFGKANPIMRGDSVDDNDLNRVFFGFEIKLTGLVVHQKARTCLNYSKFIGMRENAVFHFGNTGGYTVVELPPIAASIFKSIQINLELFKRLSSRALILTCKTPNALNCDFYFRYFAPQWGNDEDAATGSANALLLEYWSKYSPNRYSPKRLLRSEQLSSEGALFVGRSAIPKVQVFGRTRINIIDAQRKASRS